MQREYLSQCELQTLTRETLRTRPSCKNMISDVQSLWKRGYWEIKIWTFLSNLHSSSRKWEPFRCHCFSQRRADLELNPSASQGDGPSTEGAKSSKSQLLQGCPCQSCHPLTKGQEVSSPEVQWGQQLLSLLGRRLLTLAQQTGWSGHWALTRKPRGPGKELVWTYSANRQQTGKSFEGYGKCSRGQWSEIQNATTLYYGN